MMALALRALGLLKAVPAWLWVALALVSAIGVQTVRLRWANDAVAARTHERDLAYKAALARDAAIKTQNAGIIADKAAGEARERDLNARLAVARPVAARHQAKADDLAALTPKGDDALAQLTDLDAEISR